ncbi:YdcF family protein [Vibrio sp. YIC-376]|uniref:YdcF family protein n=1 Tax=Vibrio sp. YIC-376 TaxID=3136162 RepID=UPI00402AA3D8
MKLDNVVIILGKRLINNRLSTEGASRVTALVDALDSFPVNNTALIFCGGKTEGQSISEADAMFRYFQTLNSSRSIPFPESHILLENRSLNTLQNMNNAAEMLCDFGLFNTSSLEQLPINVTLLSNDYHLERIIEIQTLMDEQGLLRVLKSRCASRGLELSVSLDVKQHIRVPYPHRGTLAEAFLLLDELTTYRVYLEGVIGDAFTRDLSAVRSKPLLIAQTALEKLLTLPLGNEILMQIEEMKKAIEMTAFDCDLDLVEQALDIFHPILTLLNRTLDPESML